MASDKCMLSVINIKPIRIKKARPRIWIDGLAFTKFPTGTANSIITPTEIITAVTIMYKAPSSPLVIPTAVRILSTEKIRSINKI
ncbi:hypothetical protein D3C80_1798700 [compost metagenome]